LPAGKPAVTGLLVFACTTVLSMLPSGFHFADDRTAVLHAPTYAHFNAIVSNNLLPTDCNVCLRHRFTAAIASSKSIAALELSLFMEDPLAHTDLNIRKLPRLFAEPWNDFRRQAILPERFEHQTCASVVCRLRMGCSCACPGRNYKSIADYRCKGVKDNSGPQGDADELGFKRNAKTVSLLFLLLAGTLFT